MKNQSPGTHLIFLYLYMESSEEEPLSLVSEDVLSDDLEKTNAVVAAFTVVAIFSLLLIETFLSVIFMVYNANGDQQSLMIAHSKDERYLSTFNVQCSDFCKISPSWRMIENSTASWCDLRRGRSAQEIFYTHFYLRYFQDFQTEF